MKSKKEVTAINTESGLQVLITKIKEGIYISASVYGATPSVGMTLSKLDAQELAETLLELINDKT